MTTAGYAALAFTGTVALFLALVVAYALGLASGGMKKQEPPAEVAEFVGPPPKMGMSLNDALAVAALANAMRDDEYDDCDEYDDEDAGEPATEGPDLGFLDGK